MILTSVVVFGLLAIGVGVYSMLLKDQAQAERKRTKAIDQVDAQINQLTAALRAKISKPAQQEDPFSRTLKEAMEENP